MDRRVALTDSAHASASEWARRGLVLICRMHSCVHGRVPVRARTCAWVQLVHFGAGNSCLFLMFLPGQRVKFRGIQLPGP